jgi:hypothetical protein
LNIIQCQPGGNGSPSRGAGRSNVAAIFTACIGSTRSTRVSVRPIQAE